MDTLPLKDMSLQRKILIRCQLHITLIIERQRLTLAVERWNVGMLNVNKVSRLINAGFTWRHLMHILAICPSTMAHARVTAKATGIPGATPRTPTDESAIPRDRQSEFGHDRRATWRSALVTSHLTPSPDLEIAEPADESALIRCLKTRALGLFMLKWISAPLILSVNFMSHYMLKGLLFIFAFASERSIRQSIAGCGMASSLIRANSFLRLPLINANDNIFFICVTPFVNSLNRVLN
jgi:hypothetical protein